MGTASNLMMLLRAMGGSDVITDFRDAAEEEMQHLASLIQPGEHAVTRHNTAPPGKGVNAMMRDMPLAKKARLLPVVLGTMNSVTRCGTYMKDKLTPSRQSADADVWEQVRDVALASGALDVGFVRINEHDIFKDYAIPYQSAVVFTIQMDKEAIDTAPGYDALIEVLSTYGSLGDVAIALTEHLREQGYGAYPGFPIGGLVDYVRVAQDAGLGAIGYHGMLISPGDGTRQRINVVFTNMDIPEPAANPHAWVREVCELCQNCVRSCPPAAIYTEGELEPSTGRKTTIHYERCVEYYGDNQGCAVCIKVCPFSAAGYDKVKQGYMDIYGKDAADANSLGVMA